jgi:hypothetical protein
MRTVAARICSLVVRAVTNTAHRKLIAVGKRFGVRIGFTGTQVVMGNNKKALAVGGRDEGLGQADWTAVGGGKRSVLGSLRGRCRAIEKRGLGAAVPLRSETWFATAQSADTPATWEARALGRPQAEPNGEAVGWARSLT